MYEYQKNRRYFAQVAGGLEELGFQELMAMGAKKIEKEFRGLSFTTDKYGLYKINYCSRLISRVIAPLVSFSCGSTDELYNKASEIQWEDFLSPDLTFAVFANVSGSKIDHSQFAALRLKDAIADYFMKKYGRRPDVDPKDPDVWLNLHIRHDEAVIGFDTSGGSLHRRGYRTESVSAPMQETLAAALLKASGWAGTRRLYDPMCGSGTILTEALMLFCNIPAAYLRDYFGFQFLPDYDDELWEKVKGSADGRIKPLPEGVLAGSDVSSSAIKAARTNLALLPGGDQVELTVADLKELDSLERRIIVTNPPYGIRMEKEEGMEEFYSSLGDFLKKKCLNSDAYIYFGDMDLIKSLGLKASWKKPLKNGGLDGRLVKIEVFEGTRRPVGTRKRVTTPPVKSV